MDHRSVRSARALAAGLVFVTAAYHLYWGLPRSLVYGRAMGTFISSGLPPDPRPFLFVAYAVALLGGPYLVTREVVSLRRAYQLGLVAVCLSVLAWVVWHQVGVDEILTGTGVRGGHSHETGVLRTVVDHYVAEPVEGAIKSVELLAAALFAFLLRADPAVQNGA